MTIPSTDGVTTTPDSLGASAAGGVDVDSGDDKKMLGFMNEFAQSMSEDDSSLETTTPATGLMSNVTASAARSTLSDSPDLSPSTNLAALTQTRGEDGKGMSFSQTDPQGNSITASSRRLDDGGFKADIEMETKFPDGTTASRSTAQVFEDSEGVTRAEYTTEMFDQNGNLTYHMRKTQVEGEGVTVFEKTRNADGSFSETTSFTPESA